MAPQNNGWTYACKHCEWGSGQVSSKDYLRCRYNPPIVVCEYNETAVSVWPYVAGDDWCSKWQVNVEIYKKHLHYSSGLHREGGHD